jgi:hypothetical protein
MLEITIPSQELWDPILEEFRDTKERTLKLEHSLISLSKWESKWKKPFLSNDSKSVEETIDYIKCMTITQNVDDDVYFCITDSIIDKVNEYIDDDMTATTFSNLEKGSRKEVVTAELIYYWMIALNVPFECQKWHLNKLLTLINVCNIKNQPNKKKMSRKDLAIRNKSLNAQRRKALGTKG